MVTTREVPLEKPRRGRPFGNPGDVSLVKFAQTPEDNRQRSPEEKLALAVLESALSDIRLGRLAGLARQPNDHHSRLSLFGEYDRDWIERSDYSHQFTFVRICELFCWDPEWVREGVRRWIKAGCPKLRQMRTAGVRDGGIQEAEQVA